MSGKHYKKKENKLRKLRDIVKTYSHLNFTSNSLCSLIPALHIVNDYADSGAINTFLDYVMYTITKEKQQILPMCNMQVEMI